MPFTKRALGFFRGLARHNEKPWFEAHRDEYETEVRQPMRDLIEDLDTRFAEFAPEIGGDPKRSMFRINRDIRFSKDKSPYKTHAACWFHHLNAARTVGAEADAGSAGYYFHLQPGGKSGLGAGIWMPPRPQLKKLREAIAKDPKGFDRMARSIPRRFGGLDDEGALKRMPRGYAEDHPAAKWLRFQSFTSGRTLTDAQVTSASLATFLAREYEALLPLVRWLNGALGFKTGCAAVTDVQTTFSTESGRTYQLDRLIGKGGFGEVYLATPTPRDGLPEQVCIKITERLSSWLREAYFAELLFREPRALRVYDRFAEVENGRARYCIALEYAVHGDLSVWLEKKGAQSERFVRREIAAILQPLDILHRGQALHRDLTPFNVFVCEDEQLKLGDFGIAMHQRSQRGVTADAFNVFNVPAEIAWGRVRRWQQRDDIYQVGLIAAMILRGDTASSMSSRAVRRLPCSDHLKEVIYRCLGARGKRYEAAGELIKALRHRPKEPHLGRVLSLKGKRLSFTGFLSRPRSEAIAAAKRAGAIVQTKPGPSSDVLVRGRPNALQIAGAAGGTKLLEIRRLASRGQIVKVIGERQFWRLAESGARARSTSRSKAKRAKVRARQ